MSPSRTSKKSSSAVSKKRAAAKGQKKTAGRGSPAKASAAKGASKKKAGTEKAPKKAKTTAKSKTTTKKSTRASVAKKAPKKAATKVKTEKKTAAKTAVVKTKAPTIPAYLKNKKWLLSQRELLVEERAKYTRNADMLAAEAAELMADREPGDVQFDEESGEGDTIAVERDRDLALSAQARESVAEIDTAFERMEAGTYGICVEGGDFIPKERLEAIPEASVCVQHKTAMF